MHQRSFGNPPPADIDVGSSDNQDRQSCASNWAGNAIAAVIAVVPVISIVPVIAVVPVVSIISIVPVIAVVPVVSIISIVPVVAAVRQAVTIVAIISRLLSE
jgi:hypothetical protein